MGTLQWDQIDWPRSVIITAIFAVASALVAYVFSRERGGVVVYLEDPPRSHSAIFSPVDWVVFALVWVMCFVSVAGGGIVLGAVHDEGLYAEATAAWLQAVGSLLAILATLLVATYAARKDERARRRSENEALAARVVAIRSLEAAFRKGVEVLRGSPMTIQTVTRLPEEIKTGIRAAEAAIAAILRLPTELGPEPLRTLTLASEIGGHWRSRLDAEGAVVGPDNGQAYVRLIEQAAEEVADIAKQAQDYAIRRGDRG